MTATSVVWSTTTAAPSTGSPSLADDISGLPDEGLFDVIICSHVLEHVSEIAEQVRALRERLTPGGILYAEKYHRRSGPACRSKPSR